MYLPLTNELVRQVNQGFLERKFGLIREGFSFSILGGESFSNVFLDNFQGLVIGLDNLKYREPERYASYGGRELNNLPSSDYSSFKDLVNLVVPVLGSGGKALAASYQINQRGTEFSWELDYDKPCGLDESLDSWRWGLFFYDSGDRNAKLRFSPNSDPSKNYGTLNLAWKLRDFSDLPIEDIEKLETVLQDVYSKFRVKG